MELASILIKTNKGSTTWSEPEISSYNDEKHLQQVLSENPHLVPHIEAGSAAVRELNTDAGPIDICIVTPDGSLTVVECKLSRNSEHRRRVVGQVIDYAAALRGAGYSSFIEKWHGRGGPDLDTFLGAEARERLETSINDGTINLCLAVDQIDGDIRRLIEYLNLVTRESVMVTALQLSYARLGEVEILVPTTYGVELANAKSHSSTSSGERWTWDTFMAALSDPDDQKFARGLETRLAATPTLGDGDKMWFGKCPKGGVFFYPHGHRFSPFQLWINSTGRLTVFPNNRVWHSIRDHQGFGELANVLGQDVEIGPRTVLASEVDLDGFWAAVLDCDLAINQISGK